VRQDAVYGVYMTGIREGDEVRVFDVNSPAQRRCEYDPGRPAEVIKVGRKLVTIRGGGGDGEYRLDTQQLNHRDWGLHHWFRTLEQVEEKRREYEALKVLNRIGCTPGDVQRAGLTLEQIETLADVVASFGLEG
jgi:hypothetical protein